MAEIPRFWRTKLQRISFTINLHETNGHIIFPPRPFPTDSGCEEKQRAIVAAINQSKIHKSSDQGIGITGKCYWEKWYEQNIEGK